MRDLNTVRVTARQGAAWAHVQPATIRDWKRNGWLASAGIGVDGADRFILADVLRAETRARAARKRRTP